MLRTLCKDFMCPKHRHYYCNLLVDFLNVKHALLVMFDTAIMIVES